MVRSYSQSYYRGAPAPANGTTKPCDLNPHDGKCTANLRKNPGFHLVQQGDDLLIHRRPRNGVAFEVVVRRDKAVISISVDGTYDPPPPTHTHTAAAFRRSDP